MNYLETDTESSKERLCIWLKGQIFIHPVQGTVVAKGIFFNGNGILPACVGCLQGSTESIDDNRNLTWRVT